MDNNNYIVLSYSLFAEVDGERMMLEQTEMLSFMQKIKKQKNEEGKDS